MALRWKLYRSGLLPEVDISERIRANTISVRTNAEEGSVAISSVVVDDPVGNINIPGLYYGLNGYETEAPAGLQSFYHSIITDRTVSRGDSSKSYRTAAAREWTLQTADQNTLLSRRVLLGADANRPAETDVQRVLYLMTTPEMLAVDATDYINTAGPVAMDACDYRGQMALAALDDCAQASGKNYWVMLREDIGYAAYGLWYDFPESTAYASAITISNVAADVSASCFAAAFDTTLTRDPSRVYSGVYMPYDGGSVYVNSASTQSNFQGRDTTAPSVNVKTAAKANARAIRYLADIATEEDRIATSIIVPNAQVNALKEGHLVYARFSHLPGYETSTGCRVLNRTVVQVSEEFYRIEVELSPVDVPPAPQACVAYNDTTYAFTEAGTYYGLGPPVFSGNWFYTSTELLVYDSNPISYSQYPLAGEYHHWGNGGTGNGVYTSGGVDYGAGGGIRWIGIRLIGPGTLTVATAAQTGDCAGSVDMTMKAYAVTLGGPPAVDTDTAAPGNTMSVTIPDDGICAHYVQVGGPTGCEFGFISATWVPL